MAWRGGLAATGGWRGTLPGDRTRVIAVLSFYPQKCRAQISGDIQVIVRTVYVLSQTFHRIVLKTSRFSFSPGKVSYQSIFASFKLVKHLIMFFTLVLGLQSENALWVYDNLGKEVQQVRQ